MGTDCSTPITRFFPPNFEKKHEKSVFGVPFIWCEIRKIDTYYYTRGIHVEFTFTRI